MDPDSSDSETTEPKPGELQCLLAQHVPRLSDQVATYTPARLNTPSNPDGSDIWDYFEVTRRSACYHLKEHIHFREAIKGDAASEEVESRDLSAYNILPFFLGDFFCDLSEIETVHRSGHVESGSIWRLKVARDNLLKELEIMTDLLDVMSSTQKKGLGKFYALLASLTVTSKFTESSSSIASNIAWMLSLAALVPTVGYVGYRIGGLAVMAFCKPVLTQMYQKMLEDEVEQRDRNDLDSIRFKALWWVNYFRYS